MDLSTQIVDLLRNSTENRAVAAGTLPRKTKPGILPPGKVRKAGEDLDSRRAVIEKALADAGA